MHFNHFAEGSAIGRITLGDITKEIRQPLHPALVPLKYLKDDPTGTDLLKSQEVCSDAWGSLPYNADARGT